MAVQFRAAAGGAPAALTLMGDVGYEITAAGVAAAMKPLGADSALTISVNSYGGDALAGIAIHNMLARHKGPKTVIVEGVAASAASLIAMAGDRIVMPDNAFIMIHNAWGVAVGDSETMRGQADVLEGISAAYRRTYAKRTGLDEDAVAALMAEEVWFSAEDALAKGFATAVYPPVNVQAFAAVPAGRFHKLPEALKRAAAPNPPHAGKPAGATKEGLMPDETNPAGPVPAPQAAAPAVTPTAPLPVLATAEEVLATASRAGLDIAWAQARIAEKLTPAALRDAAIDAMASAAPRPVAPARVLVDEADKFAECATEALTARFMNRAPTAQGAELYGMGLHGMIREHASRAGLRNVHRMSAEALADLVLRPQASQHSTSDFAGVLANSTNKTLRELYGSYPATWSGWTDEIEVDDFKTITAASMGQFPEPQVLAEGATVPAASIAEEYETYNVKERGRLVVLSRQAIINDDLRAFQRVTQNAALGCYTALRRVVFGQLTANGNLRDTAAIFTTGRGNLGTAAALSATTLRQLFQLLMQQTSPYRGPDAASASLPPPSMVALLVPPEEAITAMELTTALIQPTAVGATLPQAYRQMIEVVPEAFLNTGNGPYYMARKDIRPMEVAYLRGRRAPTVTSAEDIHHTGVTFRVLFDFEAQVVTPRTIAANLNV